MPELEQFETWLKNPPSTEAAAKTLTSYSGLLCILRPNLSELVWRTQRPLVKLVADGLDSMLARAAQSVAMTARAR